ncbi:MOSC domain-containing protein [Paenibacillus sp. 481]|uniref:MOSC domain-containing protein n=1 Tax=Paenibacillus sp. 481 TaxID=2835869 RepID=UPI001E599906|nr:MOSC N-terminal beta barrel domain-containing protein [Paenibacillus sp. 481]UHA72183.1 MOSC domain-containing protein [Paenibacillus sp. 481]
MNKVGVLQEIVRHPIKSLHGESVQRTHVMSYGLYGDRSHVLWDQSRPGKYLTMTQCPDMVKYRARFVMDEALGETSGAIIESSDLDFTDLGTGTGSNLDLNSGLASGSGSGSKDILAAYPPVEITTPTGEVIRWTDAAFQHEMEQLSGRELSLEQYATTEVLFGAIEEEHVLIVTDASLQALHPLWGQEANFHRFRPNLLLALNEPNPFAEETWFGKTLHIGDVQLKVQRYCERCMIITIDPDSAEQDASLLKWIAKERSNHFGVYATVVKTGIIEAGQAVWLSE